MASSATQRSTILVLQTTTISLKSLTVEYRELSISVYLLTLEISFDDIKAMGMTADTQHDAHDACDSHHQAQEADDGYRDDGPRWQGLLWSNHRRHQNRFMHLLLFEWIPYTAFLSRTHPFCSVVSLSQPISHTHPHIINNAN